MSEHSANRNGVASLPYTAPFPASTQKLIMDYHRAHSNSLRLAQTIGEHSDIFAPFLAEYFGHIHVSHRNSDTLRNVRETLGSFYSTNWWKAKFSISINPPEESHLAVAKGGVDLCFLLAPEGWADVGQVLDAVAESLAPNGTMAMLSPSRVPAILAGPETVRSAVHRLYKKWALSFREALANEKMISWYNSPLDFVPLRHEEGDSIWIQDVTKRIEINLRNGDGTSFSIPGWEGVQAPPMVGPAQRRFGFGGENEMGKAWTREVDGQWFRQHITSIEDPDRLHLYEDELRGVDKAIAESTEDGTVVVDWAASILLATRK